MTQAPSAHDLSELFRTAVALESQQVQHIFHDFFDVEGSYSGHRYKRAGEWDCFGSAHDMFIGRTNEHNSRGLHHGEAGESYDDPSLCPSAQAETVAASPDILCEGGPSVAMQRESTLWQYGAQSVEHPSLFDNGMGHWTGGAEPESTVGTSLDPKQGRDNRVRCPEIGVRPTLSVSPALIHQGHVQQHSASPPSSRSNSPLTPAVDICLPPTRQPPHPRDVLATPLVHFPFPDITNIAVDLADMRCVHQQLRLPSPVFFHSPSHLHDQLSLPNQNCLVQPTQPPSPQDRGQHHKRSLSSGLLSYPTPTHVREQHQLSSHQHHPISARYLPLPPPHRSFPLGSLPIALPITSRFFREQQQDLDDIESASQWRFSCRLERRSEDEEYSCCMRDLVERYQNFVMAEDRSPTKSKKGLCAAAGDAVVDEHVGVEVESRGELDGDDDDDDDREPGEADCWEEDVDGSDIYDKCDIDDGWDELADVEEVGTREEAPMSTIGGPSITGVANPSSRWMSPGADADAATNNLQIFLPGRSHTTCTIRKISEMGSLDHQVTSRCQGYLNAAHPAPPPVIVARNTLKEWEFGMVNTLLRVDSAT